jgi:hypothetical protein
MPHNKRLCPHAKHARSATRGVLLVPLLTLGVGVNVAGRVARARVRANATPSTWR